MREEEPVSGQRYPPIEPYDHGWLDVGGGHLVYWETCGDPKGKPAVVVHGGPGSGCAMWQRRLFDPTAYRIVLFDQRNCGRSTPRASEPEVDLSTNTTQHLVADMASLRQVLGIDRWLVFGGSWGSTLALAYTRAYPGSVSEMVLWGVTTGRRSEDDWWFRGGVAPVFPEQWQRLLAGAGDPDGDIVEAYSQLLHDADPDVRGRAALDWCTWESATPGWPPTDELDDRFTDPGFALAFARIVTHYVRHGLFLDDGVLLRDPTWLRGIPGVLVNGRFDLQAPIGNAWALHRVWPDSDLVIVEDAGHGGNDEPVRRAIVNALDRFAAPHRGKL